MSLSQRQEYIGMGSIHAIPDETKGLTVREYFAAFAMQAIVTKNNLYLNNRDGGKVERATAKGAVAYADALIAELYPD